MISRDLALAGTVDESGIQYNDVVAHDANYVGMAGRADLTGSSGNISDDPLFSDYSDDGDFSNDDFTLQAGSPCEGAGSGGGDIGAWGL